MRPLLYVWVSCLAFGCSGGQFSTATRSGLAEGGPGANGGASAGGSSSGGARATGGSKQGGATGAGGANAGGSSAGGSIGVGGVIGNGGAIGDGGGIASDGGTVIGNGGVNAGGGTANGGTSAGGGVNAGGVSAGGVVGNGGVSAGGVVGNGGAPSRQSGDCTIGLDDCHNGTNCVEVTPGGYRVCAVKYPDANGCAMSGQCCQSSDCQNGQRCLADPLAPVCGGPVVLNGNVCASDTCTSDSACGAGSICAPAGTFQRKVAMCVPAGCHHDTDCTLSGGGICAPVSGGCCNIPLGLYCVYLNKSCRSNADCASSNCAIDPQGFSFCSPDPVLCPV